MLKYADIILFVVVLYYFIMKYLCLKLFFVGFIKISNIQIIINDMFAKGNIDHV